MSFIAKQPNGLYCIFDDIDDQPKSGIYLKKIISRFVLKTLEKEQFKN